jgi:hypothetical protein
LQGKHLAAYGKEISFDGQVRFQRQDTVSDTMIACGLRSILSFRKWSYGQCGVLKDCTEHGAPPCLFDSAQYLARYPDVQTLAKAADHYINTGIKEGRSPCGARNPSCYFEPEVFVRLNSLSLATNTASAKAAATQFYKDTLQSRLSQGLSSYLVCAGIQYPVPRCVFNPSAYLSAYSADVKSSYLGSTTSPSYQANLLAFTKTHYTKTGMTEKNSPCGTISRCYFDYETYIKLNPSIPADAKSSEEKAKAYYKTTGINAGHAVCDGATHSDPRRTDNF